jgi:hypothetical protein
MGVEDGVGVAASPAKLALPDPGAIVNNQGCNFVGH